MEQLNNLELALEEEFEELKPRRKVLEPRTIGDYRKIMQAVTGREMKVICILTAHWKPEWYIEMASYCKEKDKTTQAKIINSWLRDARLKEIK